MGGLFLFPCALCRVSKWLVLIFNSILLHMLWKTVDAMDAMDVK